MNTKVTLFAVVALAASSVVILAEKPEVATYIKGDTAMTKLVVAALDSISKGKQSLEYEVSAVYGDGGSMGTIFKLSGGKKLEVFHPWWDKGWKDTRLRIIARDDQDTKWSETLEECQSLRNKLNSTLSQLLDPNKPPAVKDVQTRNHLAGLYKTFRNR